jgi:signal peptidase I
LGDSIVREYQFKENYYFMAGDKGDNSRDSRYWGLLPESFIVGKAVVIWKSIDPVTSSIKWERTGKKIR